MKTAWGCKRYYSLNYFLRQKFGTKVFKISLDGGFSCPNRDGTISTEGCIYCSEKGSGDFAGDRNCCITEQFQNIRNMMKNKWKDGKYIAYFQAYTNTYAPIEVLRKKYDEALRQEDVVALAVATRPDCLSEEVIDLLYEYSRKIYTWVELGLQTSDENTAEIINRGYKLNVFEDAVKRLRCRNIDVVVHVIFGLPHETETDMLDTVKYLSAMNINGVKFHLLYLLKNTPMVSMYEEGDFKFLSQEQYIDIVCRALSILSQNIVVHRLTGDAPRNLLIGPMWSLRKWEILNGIDKELEERGIFQGIYSGASL